MKIKKIVGYGLMVIGLALIVITTLLKTKIPFFSNTWLVIVIGLALIAAGFLLQKNRPGKDREEVPIYEGEGKNRKIVGYRKTKKS